MVKNKDAIKNKIYYLIDFAISESQKHKDNPYIKRYIEIAINLSKRINYRLSPEIHSKICKNCFSIRDFKNTKIRITRKKVNKALKKYIQYHCLVCGYVKKHAIIPKKHI